MRSMTNWKPAMVTCKKTREHLLRAIRTENTKGVALMAMATMHVLTLALLHLTDSIARMPHYVGNSTSVSWGPSKMDMMCMV